MLPEFVNIRRRYCRTGWAKKIKLQTLVHTLTKYWLLYSYPTKAQLSILFLLLFWRTS